MTEGESKLFRRHRSVDILRLFLTAGEHNVLCDDVSRCELLL